MHQSWNGRPMVGGTAWAADQILRLLQEQRRQTAPKPIATQPRRALRPDGASVRRWSGGPASESASDSFDAMPGIWPDPNPPTFPYPPYAAAGAPAPTWVPGTAPAQSLPHAIPQGMAGPSFRPTPFGRPPVQLAQAAPALPGPFGVPLPLPPFVIPGSPENQAYTKSVLRLFEMLRGKATPDQSPECEEEWRKAIIDCERWIAEGGHLGLTGGYKDPKKCAKGVVRAECGGNKVNRGPQPSRPKRR